MRPKTDILGIKVDNLTAEELKNRILGILTSKNRGYIIYANVNSINLAGSDPELRNILNSSGILYPDGYGVMLASKILGNTFREKITSTDFFINFCEELAGKNISMYFLGGKPGVAQKARQKLQASIPALTITGECHGYFDTEAEEKIIEKINDARPDILVVGMGTPKQEKWIYHNRHRLNVPVCWAVGAVFDFISVSIARAPCWLRKINLEWLYRLSREPKRLWRRYLLGNPLFVFRVVKFK
jgi:N-acetylglucosaminyldiphosphoundecaprenol N-acetyl-beta-D-mannosaminyltransferase